jgi:hypothetical protein
MTAGLPSEADIVTPSRHVSKVQEAALTGPKRRFRFASINGRQSTGSAGQFRANNGSCNHFTAHPLPEAYRGARAPTFQPNGGFERGCGYDTS